MRRQTYGKRVGGNPGFWRKAALVLGGIMVAVLLAGYQRPLVSAQTPINVGVLDYAIPSSAQVAGATVARYAADDLAAQLGHVSHTQLTVLSRKSVRDAASSMGWKTADLVSFTRLAQLAKNLGANYLFVGRIESVTPPSTGSAGVTATVRVAVFDAAASNNLGSATGNGLAAAVGGRDAAIRNAVHNANGKALAGLIPKLPQ